MSKIFYDHLVKIEEVTLKLDQLEFEEEEREEIVQIIEETFHNRIIELILDRLHPDKHDDFLLHFYNSPADEKLIDILKEEIADDFEKEIEKLVNKIKKEILTEIKSFKKK